MHPALVLVLDRTGIRRRAPRWRVPVDLDCVFHFHLRLHTAILLEPRHGLRRSDEMVEV